MSTVAAPQGPVEARSLSSITTIASNPPAYPRNPTHEKLDPLVLYIVRVPGSQDIFLSPLKPPTKASVSAEAINASLYYLHVATPEDDALLQEVELEREEQAQRRREALEAASEDDPAQRDFLRLNNVRRKPVGGTEPVQDNSPAPAPESAEPPPLPRRPLPMPQVSAENMSFAGNPVANVQPGIAPEPAKTPVEPVTKSAIPRRPLPPLPASEEPFRAQPAEETRSRSQNRWSAFAGPEPIPEGGFRVLQEGAPSGRHSLDSNRPDLPPRPWHGRGGSPGRSPGRSPGQSPTRQRRAPKPPRDPSAGFHLTLIRRDPSSGTQWNVATISTPRMDHNSIDIEISTPGYNRFIGSNDAISLADIAANLPAGMIRTAAPSIAPSVPSVPSESSSEQPPRPQKFHRELCVSKPFEDSAADYGNGHSENSKLKSGYYVFNSPWNGTCTFASSVNGRSLKCKHMIPGPGGQLPVQGDQETNPAVTVAEIRFNTPFQAANLHFHAATSDPMNLDPTAASKRASISQFLNPNTYSRPRAHSGSNTPFPQEHNRNFHPATILRRTSQRASQFARQNHFHSQPHTQDPRRSTSTSSGGPDSDEERLDFSLAREKAGGGMRGKSAKLGKLIIEDEGFKMLDLVVSACMGVWWRGYYH